jgi:hypothetical protein
MLRTDWSNQYRPGLSNGTLRVMLAFRLLRGLTMRASQANV